MDLSAVLQTAKLVALDAAPFIYLVERNPDFFEAVEPIFAAVDGGALQAVTSALTLAEVLVKPVEAGDQSLVDDFRAALADSTNLRVISVDRHVAERAAHIRAHHGFRTPDAIHLATAVTSGADVFLTNDERLARFEGVRVVTLRR
jgi:predicted nucleic acid-binding protein